MESLQSLVDKFLRYHTGNGSSKYTVTYYRDNLSLFAAFLSRIHGPWIDVTILHIDHVRQWIESMRVAGLSPVSIQTRVRAIKAFTHWLVAEEYLERDPLARLKLPKADDVAQETFTPEDIEQMLKTCDRSSSTGVRDFAIILLLYGSGLRSAELLNLKITDIDQEKGLIMVRHAKSRHYRQVPLGVKVARSINRYIAGGWPGQGDDYLFLSPEGDQMTYSALRYMIERRGRECDIHSNIHKFRHSFAVAYLRNKGRIEDLRIILGHSNITQTLHYARLSGVDLVAGHGAVDPTRNLKVR